MDEHNFDLMKLGGVDRFQSCMVKKLPAAKIKILENEILKLKQNRQFVEKAIKNAHSEKESLKIYEALQYGAEATVITCDIIISIFSTAVFGQVGGAAFSEAYGGAKLVAKTVNGSMNTSTAIKMLAKSKSTASQQIMKISKNPGKATILKYVTLILTTSDSILKLMSSIEQNKINNNTKSMDGAVEKLKNTLKVYNNRVLDLEKLLSVIHDEAYKFCKEKTEPKFDV